MRAQLSAVTLLAVALVGVPAPSAGAAPPALPLPVPAAGADPLVGEGVSVEGPLVNTISLAKPR